MTAADHDLRAVLRDILGGELTDRIGQRPGELDTALWDRLGELGFTALTSPEADGGAGAGWSEAAALLSESAVAARHLPFAETDLLANWLLRAANRAPTEVTRPRTVAVVTPEGVARAVPWLGQVPVVLVARRADGSLGIGELTTEESTRIGKITPVPTSSGLPRADLVLDGEPPTTSVLDDAELLDRLLLRGALARAVQAAAAMEQAVDLCVRHARDRVQFGRPLAKFQAVQHLVADAAAEAALARAAVDAAVLDAADADLAGPSSASKVAVARSCVGHAASVVVRNAHQVHGAMGTTREHPLHLCTQPVLDWRSEFGTTRDWDRFLGAAARARPGALWDVVIGAPTADAIPDLPHTQRRRGDRSGR